MTTLARIQAIGFFEQVKDKKIRKTCWLAGRYIIPSKLIYGMDGSDHSIEGVNDHGITVRFEMGNGFDYLDNDPFNTWEFWDSRTRGRVISGTCSCSSYNLLNFGHDKLCVFHKELTKLGSGK